jgi:cytochrome b pre-mRNA-processing protein 3
MFASFRRTRPEHDTSSALYGAIVAQARTPALYTELGVADTVEGRFEMVVVHLALVLRRVWQGDEADRTVGQATFDVFCREMDDALRALGVKDTSVGKRMRKLAEAYYGRAGAYDAALESGDSRALADTLGRTVFGGDATVAAEPLAAYMAAANRNLAATPVDRVIAGDIAWPVPQGAAPPVENDT